MNYRLIVKSRSHIPPQVLFEPIEHGTCSFPELKLIARRECFRLISYTHPHQAVHFLDLWPDECELIHRFDPTGLISLIHQIQNARSREVHDPMRHCLIQVDTSGRQVVRPSSH